MIPSYALGILAQGNCPALVKGGVFSSQDRVFFAWDRSGLTGIRKAVAIESQKNGCSSAKAFLAVSVRTAASFEAADDWLLPPECLDTSPENVWYDPLEKRVLLCLAEKSAAQNDTQNSMPFALFELLLQLAAFEAPEVYPYIKKLSKRAKEENLPLSAIKKELSQRLIGPG